VIGTTIEVFFL